MGNQLQELKLNLMEADEIVAAFGSRLPEEARNSLKKRIRNALAIVVAAEAISGTALERRVLLPNDTDTALPLGEFSINAGEGEVALGGFSGAAPEQTASTYEGAGTIDQPQDTATGAQDATQQHDQQAAQDPAQPPQDDSAKQ